MKVHTVGPISFVVLGIIAAIGGAILENTTNIDPFAAYAGGALAFILGLYLAIDRKTARNIFKFAT